MSFTRTQSIYIVALGVLVVAVWGIWTPLLSQSRGQLIVHMLDVGQGDATFIRTPNGHTILIDGGRDAGILRTLARVMPFWERDIDLVVATHPDADHVGGLFEVVQRFHVGAVLRPGVAHDAPAAQSLFTLISTGDITETLARRGAVYDFGDGVRLYVLFPDRDVSGLEPNTASVVMQLRYGAHAFMLTGDAPAEIEEYLVTLDTDMLRSDVLKVGHHGSDTSTSELFLGFVDPQYGVISRGCDNRYGHPHQSVLDTLARFEVAVIDTCHAGTVEFVSDGETLQLRK